MKTTSVDLIKEIAGSWVQMDSDFDR